MNDFDVIFPTQSLEFINRLTLEVKLQQKKPIIFTSKQIFIDNFFFQFEIGYILIYLY